MKGGLGSRIPGGEMMSFMKNGGKNDTQIAAGKEEELSLFRELKNSSNQHKHRNLVLLHPLSLSDEFDFVLPNCPLPNHIIPNGNNYQRHQMLGSIPSSASKKGSSSATSDFFLVENDKYDYDWLKTPPATPLFPSIEMETTYNNKSSNNNGQLFLQKEPLPQHLSRFAGGNKSEVSSKASINNMNKSNIIKKAGHNQKPKVTTAKNGVVEKNTSSGSTTTPKKSSSRSSSTSCKERPPYHASILKFSNERPPNLRTEQRSSSTTRGWGTTAIAPPRVEEAMATKPRQNSCSPSVTRGRKVEPIVVMNNNKNNNNKQQEMNRNNINGKGTVVLGSRMVEKVINARKSNNNNIFTSTTTRNIVSSGHRLKDAKPADYLRTAINQKSAFGLSRTNNNDNKTLISREKGRSR